jgi:predicted ATPase
MIKSMKISALKSIDNLDMQCKKLNIIAGTNSSGKSTAVQALLLVSQNVLSKEGLNGSRVSLGEFKTEAKNHNIVAKSIDITITAIDYEDCSLKISFVGNTIDVTDDKLCGAQEFLGCEANKCVYSLLSNIKYLSCNRIGAQDTYAKHYANENDIGVNGEYALYCLHKGNSVPLDEELIKDDTSETLLAQVNYWLEFVLNTTIQIEDIIGTDVIKARYAVGKSRVMRPKNIGSGVSYLISIIVMCLIAEKDDILIIENPEIHLHPKAQSKLCEFLYFVAKSGRQIFVETHSDHIFNGVRVGIATDSMDKNDIAVNFFELDERNCTINTVIDFGLKGQIVNHVDGLFDQFDSDLDKMLGI